MSIILLNSSVSLHRWNTEFANSTDFMSIIVEVNLLVFDTDKLHSASYIQCNQNDTDSINSMQIAD